MLIRIVKLTFKEENSSRFEALFAGARDTILNFEGCMFLELYRDKEQPNIFFTYSKWEEEMYLEAYRDSEFFKSIWVRTKPLFQDKPEVWSVQRVPGG